MNDQCERGHHDWVLETPAQTAFAQRVRRICRNCGALDTITLSTRTNRKQETFQDIYKRFFGITPPTKRS